MPDDAARLTLDRPPAPPAPRAPRRRFSPLLRRILLVNAVPPALLAASLLYLDQYQNGLLAAEVEALRTQARIYAGGIAEAAVRLDGDRAVLLPDQARPLLRRLVEPSPNTQARLFDTAGLMVADSRVREGPGGAVVSEPLPPPEPRGALTATVAGVYDRLVGVLPRPISTGSPTSAPTGARNSAWHSKAACAPISAAPATDGCWSAWRNRRAAPASRSASCFSPAKRARSTSACSRSAPRCCCCSERRWC